MRNSTLYVYTTIHIRIFQDKSSANSLFRTNFRFFYGHVLYVLSTSG